MDRFTGKIWVLGDDIDTDIIIPTEYLALKTVQDMAPYAFSPLRPELAGQIREGDIIVAGKNFGCGSSREQAPEIIKALGIRCVVAMSWKTVSDNVASAESGGYPQCGRAGKGDAETKRVDLGGEFGYGFNYNRKDREK